MGINLDIECDVCGLWGSSPTVRCRLCEETMTEIISLAREIFHDDMPTPDKEGFVKVRGDDWLEMASMLAHLKKSQEMGHDA